MSISYMEFVKRHAGNGWSAGVEVLYKVTFAGVERLLQEYKVDAPVLETTEKLREFFRQRFAGGDVQGALITIRGTNRYPSGFKEDAISILYQKQGRVVRLVLNDSYGCGFDEFDYVRFSGLLPYGLELKLFFTKRPYSKQDRTRAIEECRRFQENPDLINELEASEVLAPTVIRRDVENLLESQRPRGS